MPRDSLVVLLSFVAGTLGVPASSVAQVTIHVDPVCGDDSWSGASPTCTAPDGPKKSISATVAVAAAGDTILLGDGLYQGGLNRNVEIPTGIEITIRSANGPDNCVWSPAIPIGPSGTPDGRALYMPNTHGTGMVIEGITFQEGALGSFFGPPSPSPEPTRGGAILIRGDASVTGCVFRSNSAFRLGGALFIEGSPTITDCVFEDNFAGVLNCAEAKGGAVYVLSGQPVFANCTFAGNSGRRQGCTGTDIARGGALFAEPAASLILTSCVFSDNSASFGGALVASGAAVVDCSFRFNTASFSFGASGGGVRLTDSMVDRCTFEDNRAVSTEPFALGGGAYAFGSTLSNCVFVRNLVSGPDAGGAASWSQDCLFVNCTFAANELTPPGVCDDPPCYGAILHLDSGSIANTIIVDSVVPGTRLHLDGEGMVTYSNIEDFAGTSGTGISFGVGVIDQDPQFLPGSYKPMPGATGNDAGDNDALPSGVVLDLSGNSRFVEDPTAPNTGAGSTPLVDIGAYEFQGACYANCDNSAFLDIFDFLCFQNAYATGNSYADCDMSGTLDVFDFLCFQNAFSTAGCP